MAAASRTMTLRAPCIRTIGISLGAIVALSACVSRWSLYGDSVTDRKQIESHCVEILRSGLESSEFWPAKHAAEGLTAAGESELVRRRCTAQLQAESDD